ARGPRALRLRSLASRSGRARPASRELRRPRPRRARGAAQGAYRRALARDAEADARGDLPARRAQQRKERRVMRRRYGALFAMILLAAVALALVRAPRQTPAGMAPLAVSAPAETLMLVVSDGAVTPAQASDKH